MRNVPFGAVLLASLLWLAVGAFALLELWSIVPHGVLGTLVFIAVVPPVWLIANQSEAEDWVQLWELVSNHPNRWVRIAVGALVALFILLAAAVGLWLSGKTDLG